MKNTDKIIHISYGHDQFALKLIGMLDNIFQNSEYSLEKDSDVKNLFMSIHEYVDKLSNKENKTILIINKKYLQSKWCIFGLGEILRKREFLNSIYPIVTGDAIQYIYSHEEKSEIKRYWFEQLKNIESLINKENKQNELNLLRIEQNKTKKAIASLDIFLDYLSSIFFIRVSPEYSDDAINKELKKLLEVLL
jgi:hypothetical protein